MIEVAPFFAVPFGFAQAEGCEDLHAQLRTLFLERAADAGRYANPRPLTQRNTQVFESEFQLFQSQERCVQQLKDFCWRHLMQMVAQLNGYDAPTIKRLGIYSDSWFHVMRRGGYFALHNHPNASWSGVYCVDAGQPDVDKDDPGLLSFVNPAVMSSTFMDAATANLKGAFAYHIRHLRLQAGQLVLFPSWVMHDVKPFQGDGERITVAFNCWFRFQDQPG
jgi:uncharacterized protein (TIGR02466 family)